MENKKYLAEISEITAKLNKPHYSSRPAHQRIERLKAANGIETDELEAIYHLVESHVPGLRVKTVLRYEKILTAQTDNNKHLFMSKNNVASHCVSNKMCDNINIMLEKLKQMPPEWTMVQLTPSFNCKENIETDVEKHYTNSLYISVFKCGTNQPKPFCVYIPAPVDNINGSQIELAHEMQSIISNNRNTLIASKGQQNFKNVPEKQNYFSSRQAIDNRLKMLVKDLQEVYLKEWRCLMIGKCINSDLENKLQKRIDEFLKNECPGCTFDEKTKSLLCHLTKGTCYLKLAEVRRAIKTIFSTQDESLWRKSVQFVRNLAEELQLFQHKRHPLILVIDDSLDCFPWEMMDVFNDSPVSRLPSFHMAYHLFKEHESTIKSGFKIVENPQNGNFVVNPDLDLKNMQNRITSFFEYWTPNWKGISGCKPTEQQFEEMLVSADIFSYNGHGSGTQCFSMQKIEKTRIKAVVLLFGCGSAKLVRQGPQTEMYGTYQTYLIACSPCTVGMLWEVTDLDTDILTTELLSHWIPNSSKTHWKFLDKSKWKKGEKVNFNENGEPTTSGNVYYESELLRALSLAKKSKLLSFYTTKAACVARGIPVKIAE